MKAIKTQKALLLANTLYQCAIVGGSLNSDYESPKFGYMVGIQAGPVFNSLAEVDPILVKYWIESNLKQAEENGHFFGVWTDSNTGKVHFDISRNIAYGSDAVNLGVENNQIAIWDVENACEVRL